MQLRQNNISAHMYVWTIYYINLVKIEENTSLRNLFSELEQKNSSCIKKMKLADNLVPAIPERLKHLYLLLHLLLEFLQGVLHANVRDLDFVFPSSLAHASAPP